MQKVHKVTAGSYFKFFFRIRKLNGGGLILGLFNEKQMSIIQSERDRFASRSPKRITITIPHSTFVAIIERSNEEGRSLSNLAAFILEQGIKQ